MEKQSISGCCLVLVYEAMELAHPCVLYPVTVHPSPLWPILYELHYSCSPFICALFRQREPRDTTRRDGHEKKRETIDGEEMAPPTILTKQFKRLSRPLSRPVLKYVHSTKEWKLEGRRARSALNFSQETSYFQKLLSFRVFCFNRTKRDRGRR